MKRILTAVMVAILSIFLVTSTVSANVDFTEMTPGIANIFENIFESEVPEFTASEELTAKLISQTVSIIMLGDGMGTCSGTVIAEDGKNHYVLTAKHCIDVTEEIYVEHNNVLYIVTSAIDDLALIVVDGKIPNKTVAKLATVIPVLEDTVYHVAYPEGIMYQASGKITRNSKDWQMFDFAAIGGCSGGGIFNEAGELIAVLWGGYRFPKDKAPIKTIAEPLKDIIVFFNTIGGKL